MMQSRTEMGNFHPLKFRSKMLKHDYICKDCNLPAACSSWKGGLQVNGATQCSGILACPCSYLLERLMMILKYNQKTSPWHIFPLFSAALCLQPAQKNSPAPPWPTLPGLYFWRWIPVRTVHPLLPCPGDKSQLSGHQGPLAAGEESLHWSLLGLKWEMGVPQQPGPSGPWQ